MDAVLTRFNTKARSCGWAVSPSGAAGASRRGSRRAATLKKARQNPEERTAQEISKLIIGLIAAFGMPSAIGRKRATAKNGLWFRDAPIPKVLVFQ